MDEVNDNNLNCQKPSNWKCVTHVSRRNQKYKTDALIEFLQREEDLELDDLKVILEEKVNGRDFLKLTEEKLERHGMKLGPTSRLADFINECAIRQFPPNDDEELKQCIREIKRRLGNMGTILADSNEAMRCKYISKITKKEITLAPQLEIVGEENTALLRIAGDAFGDDFDYIYGIITTATDWYFILYASDRIYCTSKNSLNIRFTKSALKENSEDEKELCKNVK
ncbi:hypothetical protein GLOIN_2v1790575 [Rhizophagus irregularis DAOM 181602=DAOM 197198]|uniref:SAM domain-containing protein n=1 Tax=Rhizophagus irregularis (strain DAOM 181602 / DAOM 197198 / MUCL 43194) TaxID=747089 RepID=A0A2P4NYT4_RHIID|nr:hypothetical protein GLOIN_2v1790575 [Rhizophagus irregularis DAOM 181602=DAOM 197198]POG58300.1 hypothetical protein GLOIN_2v1790575 [Rhizophagus irregularis DAOM 181602=DAOM 197198]|eukprot:XP_025165166.1 hypothetical protein GLOIN_2v1790575 [Rhizophagus irregularis DAOM 181602=DAOM 197198]